MAKNNKTISSNIKKLQLQILVIFITIVFIMTTAVVVVILGKSSSSTKKTVSGLVAANSSQLEMNINSYLSKVETTAALLFSDDDYYQYDATDESLDEYTKVKSEEKIQARIVDLGLMENYADFGIVYANDYTVGWISLTTSGMFPSGGMYEQMSGYITDDNKESGWVFGLCDNFERMYYVKRINPNAILLVSFYTRELTSVFEYPEELKGMTIRLINDDNTILYSSEKDEIGSTVPEAEVGLIGTDQELSVTTNKYFVNTNICENGWRVVCFVPMDIVIEQNRSLQRFALVFSIVIGIIFAVVGFYLIHKISKPVDGILSNLQNKAERDQLSGLLNKISYQDMVAGRLPKLNSATTIVLIIFDVDNFKKINDNLGHAYGDQVITRIGRLARDLFGGFALVGRIGGDEFSVYIEYAEGSQMNVPYMTEAHVRSLQNEFDIEFKEEHEKCNVSLSVGAFIGKAANSSFDEIYKKADSALYYSKRNGKHRYTQYSDEMGEAQDE
jgi:diguanylate cyclase (GGDEF)-like protein